MTFGVSYRGVQDIMADKDAIIGPPSPSCPYTFHASSHNSTGTWIFRISRMSLKQIDLTTALRPSLLPDEVLLFVQDSVGLYEG